MTSTDEKQEPHVVDDESKITREEMIELFGQEMPIEAATLVWDAVDSMTVGQVRARLRELAKGVKCCPKCGSANWDDEGRCCMDCEFDAYNTRLQILQDKLTWSEAQVESLRAERDRHEKHLYEIINQAADAMTDGDWREALERVQRLALATVNGQDVVPESISDARAALSTKGDGDE